MKDSYKTGFEFIVKIKGSYMVLYRRSNTSCFCPFNDTEITCSSMCPHFVVENCSIIDRKCSLILTCGRHISRLVEIIE
jgi:hypothetical protein